MTMIDLEEDRFHDGLIRSAADMLALVRQKGFLPLIGPSFSRNTIPGFSVEEFTPREYWFLYGVEAPGNGRIRHPERPGCLWKAASFPRVIRESGMVPDLMNWRRSHFRFRPKRESKEKLVYETIQLCESLQTGEIREACGFRRRSESRANARKKASREHSMEHVLMRLMMGTYLVIHSFEQHYDRNMQPYGWGIARYTTPEHMFGAEALRCDRTPEESAKRILEKLAREIPDATDAAAGNPGIKKGDQKFLITLSMTDTQ